jgi:hypothetical protein
MFLYLFRKSSIDCRAVNVAPLRRVGQLGEADAVLRDPPDGFDLH